MTQLATLDQDQLALYQEFAGAGYDNFGEQEMVKPPTLAIAQPTSDHPDKGNFHLSGETLGTDTRIVPLHIQRTRNYRPGEGYDSPRTCWSKDFWNPAEDVSERQHNTCAKRGPGKPIILCPRARWETVGGVRQAPPCAETWVMAVAITDADFNVDPNRVALYYLQSMALGPARSFVGGLRTKFRQLPMFGIAADLEISYKQKKDGFAGNFYVPDFPDPKDMADQSRLHLVPVAKLPELHELHKFFVEYFAAGHADDGGEVTQANPSATLPTPSHGQQSTIAESPAASDDWGA